MFNQLYLYQKYFMKNTQKEFGLNRVSKQHILKGLTMFEVSVVITGSLNALELERF